MIPQKSKIAILGGGGKTGKFIVREMLKRGYGLKLLLRDPAPFADSSMELIRGDALDCSSIELLLEGCAAIVNTIGQRPGEPLVASVTTSYVLRAMPLFGVRRYIVLAGLNVDTPDDEKGPITQGATEWMKANYPDIHEDRKKSYSLLRESSVDWTMVRVPFIRFEDAGLFEVNSKDCKGTDVNAGSIAEFIADQLADRSFFGKSPFIYNIKR